MIYFALFLGFFAAIHSLVLQHKVNRIMADQAQLTQTINGVNAKLQEVASGIDNLDGDITTLQNQVQELKDAAQNAGTVSPELQAAIDNLDGTASGLRDKVNVVKDRVPDQIPIPDPNGA